MPRSRATTGALNVVELGAEHRHSRPRRIAALTVLVP